MEIDRHRFYSSNKKYIYHVGIIDYLQDFNLDKILENKFKTLFRSSNAEISAVEPNRYASRYLKFMRDHVFINQTEEEKDVETLAKHPTRRF